MRCWVCLTLVGLVLLVHLVADNEVKAAPEPCAFWDHHHYHYQEATTVAPTTSTQPPEDPKNEEKDNDKKERKKARFKKLEKLLWGQTWEMQEPQDSNLMESFVKSYLDILSYLFNIF